MDADLALRWMSEAGAGRASDLRERLTWLAHTEDTPITRTATGRWLRDISALGHAEVDWENDRWSMAPPVITPLPFSDGTAVLAGSRRCGLIDRLEATQVSVLTYRPDPAPADLPVPTVVLMQYDDVEGLKAAAAWAGATYSGCAALKLVDNLPSLSLGAEAAPPAEGNRTVERFDVSGVSFSPASADRDGLYRLRLQGRLVHLYRQDGVWRHCDLPNGVFTEYSSKGVSVIRWRPERSMTSGQVGTVFLDWGSPLPALHARALTLCSGLPPRFSQAARTAIYGNVPRTVASAAAKSLVQRLQDC